MDYELAKQLKDAGFKESNGWKWHEGEVLPVPTLSELIEACGNNIALQGFTNQSSPKVWTAYNSSNIDGEYGDYDLLENGKTPEEAVAKLWLELNKK